MTLTLTLEFILVVIRGHLHFFQFKLVFVTSELERVENFRREMLTYDGVKISTDGHLRIK